ncbi:MAG: hypothetical protein IK092_03790 [Muribaculaceae bacterium]|nr:hypothetical protein [Muribaculaceae bacterium]
MRKYLVYIAIVMLSLTGLAQESVVWNVDFNTVLNNREGGDDAYAPDQTFFFTRITPQIGLSLDNDSHRIMGGVTWYQPMNNECSGYKVLPALYYEYRGENTTAQLGIIPSTIEMPLYLRSDSIHYLEPNIRGLALTHNYSGACTGTITAWLDWRQMQTTHHREAFDVTLAHKNWFSRNHDDNEGGFYSLAYLRYNHLAKRKGSPDEDNVNDNLIVNPMLGYRFVAGAHKLDINAGMLLSCDRDRVDMHWHNPVGFIGNASWNFKAFTLKELVYAGERQMPHYDKYGSQLYLGDAYFHNKFYSRTDLVATLLNTGAVNLSAQLSFHATNDVTAFWQQLMARVYINGKGKNIETPTRKLKALF